MSCSSLQTNFEKVMNFYCTDEEAGARGMRHNFLKKVNQKKFVKLIEDIKQVKMAPKETVKGKTKHEKTEPKETKHEETKYEETKHEETKHEENKHEETKHEENKHEETKHEEAKHEETKHEETKHEETKHEEMKHDEAKHEETKHEETKHEETKYEETKHEETKHEETKHEETKHEESEIDEINVTNGNDCSAAILKDDTKLMKEFLHVKGSSEKLLIEKINAIELVCKDVESKIEKTERKLKQKWRIFGKRNLRIQLSKYEYVRGKYVEMLNNIKVRLEFEFYSIIQLPVKQLNERLI